MLLLAVLLAAAPADAGRERPPNVSEVRLPEVEAAPFTFGRGDRFSIKVFRHNDLDSELTVAPDGAVTFPLVGRMEIAGKTYEEVVSELEDALDNYFQDVSVAVNVEAVKNRKVFVVGEVASPQVYQITSELRVLEALMGAGGISPDVRTDNILLIRAINDSPELFTVDVRKLLTGDLTQNIALQPDDIVVVPAKTIVNVERFFRRISGILGPFVSGTQIYRNVNIPGTQFIDDGTTSGN